jgi:GT2 family glycosyltransferase
VLDSARPLVCAVVVTYNRADLLRTCLAALGRQTHTPAHVLVVDNASTDHTPSVLAEFGHVEVDRLPANAGSAGGFARGIERAAGGQWDLLWVMDDDVEPAADALERLVAAMRPGVAAAGPVKIGSDGKVQPLHIADYDAVWMRKRAVVPAPGEEIGVTFLSFVCLLVRSDVARREVPRADLFIDQDDTEYSLRLARHGRLVGVGASRVVHHNNQAAQTRRVLGRTVVDGARWRVYYAVRNPLLIGRAHLSASAWRASVAVAAWRLLLRLPAALLHHRGDLGRWLLAARGFRDGLRGTSGPVVSPRDYA